ncbi:hypothetical protein [Streptomyces sp. NPDC059009]|uniref:hypothetical protein n=1 Tax=Streptomyces sp. NPDC059009 TaxID=3346694 RepID=UPI0036981E4A
MRTRFRATVPARLRLLRAAALALTLALVLLVLLAGLAARGTWDDIADRDAPRTTSAATLNLDLNDMDAQVANILLANGDAGRGRLDVPYRKAVDLYGSARHGVSRELRTLAVAAQGDPGAERTVERLTEDFAEYQELAGRALENTGRPGGKKAALHDYRSATDLLQKRLLPEARKLVDTTDASFNARYEEARSNLGAQLAALLALGVVLLLVLGVLQWYLARRFRRILNPGVLAATVCALTAVILGAQLLSASSAHLEVARRDAFDSVVALSRARAIAYDANADESRYLLDAERRAQYTEAFFAKSQKLYGITGATMATYDDQLDRTWDAYVDDQGDLRFSGEFRRELDNITFDGERAAAEDTVEKYAVYQRDDRKIRDLATGGEERRAAEFCMGWREGTSNDHFGQWMDALATVTKVNRDAFDDAVRDGRDGVSAQLPWIVGALLAAGVLTVVGLRPRLGEFG